MIDKQDPHSMLVKKLFLWVQENCDCSGDHYSISTDHIGDQKPPTICGSIPDVFAITIDSTKIVVGEAETEEGLLTKHTEQQFRSLLIGCASYHEAVFVIAVPWHMTARAKTILKQLKKELNAEQVSTLVLERIGM